MPLDRRSAGLRSLVLAALIAVSLTACVESITKHGHQFHEGDIGQVSPGMSQEQVRTVLGTPTTTAAVGTGSAFYYISSTQGQTTFLTPKEKDRRVVAVYFGQMGSVDRVAQYGLKDGKVFDYVRSIVKLQPQPLAKAAPELAPELKGPVAADSEAGAPSAWVTQVVASKPSRKEPVQTAR